MCVCVCVGGAPAAFSATAICPPRGASDTALAAVSSPVSLHCINCKGEAPYVVHRFDFPNALAHWAPHCAHTGADLRPLHLAAGNRYELRFVGALWQRKCVRCVKCKKKKKKKPTTLPHLIEPIEAGDALSGVR